MHGLPWVDLPGGTETSLGIWITAVGAVAFVVGVWVSRNVRVPAVWTANLVRPTVRFWIFCVATGLGSAYVLLPMFNVASLSAVLNALSLVWTLGVLLGLRHAILSRRPAAALGWCVVLLANPLLILVYSGFLGYGSMAIIICVSGLVPAIRRWPVFAALSVVGVYLGLSLFVSYFSIRDDIRYVAWSSASMGSKFDATMEIAGAASWFDIRNYDHADYLDQRLNQNYFVGLSAERLAAGQVEWFRGQSFVDGLIAMIPRIVWPEKPLGGGSGRLVADLTGLDLSYDSSFGVGNVLELYANFGWPSLIAGFLGLGWVLGRLDLRAAIAEREGRYRPLLVSYLIAVGLIQPNGSIVELTAWTVSAWLAGHAAGWLWTQLEHRRLRSAGGSPAYPTPYAPPAARA